MENSIPTKKRRKINKSFDAVAFGKRFLGLLIDYLAWYIWFVILFIIFYLVKNGGVESMSNYEGLDWLESREITRSPWFVALVSGFVIIWEAVIPMITNGYTLTKKKLKIKIINLGKPNKLAIGLRGFLKSMTVHPYAPTVYVALTGYFEENTAIILSVMFAIASMLHFFGKRQVYDIICKTTVVSVSD